MASKFIPYARQSINEEDVNAVIATLNSEYLTQGSNVTKFEESISTYTSSKYCLTFNSATSALHAACLSLGLKEGDLLWTSTISFVASANCALYCGAKVDFVDIDPATFNLSIDCLEAKLLDAKKLNKLPKILVVVHLAGFSCDMRRIWDLSNLYGFKVIEDASHAIGGDYKGLKIGSCKFSHLTVFSFHPVKIITTGEGGAITTNDKNFYDKLSLFRSHGITKDSAKFSSKLTLDWYYEQQLLGYNYRLTDIQAALGISQLKRIDKFIDSRRIIAKRYSSFIDHEAISTLKYEDFADSAFHLYILRIKNDLRDKLKAYLENYGIGTNLHYFPIHLQPYYLDLGFKFGMFPVAEEYSKSALSIPMFYDLSQEQQNLIIDLINNFK